MNEPERVVLVLRFLPTPARPSREEPWHGVPWDSRLARALKALLRQGIECVEMREEKGGQAT